MAAVKRNRHTRNAQYRTSKTDFSKVGGLANHVKVLREIIIMPLLYGDLYHHFNIKAPRGVIFHGPPGTGKTLVAGALATELNKEGEGKVSFYQRKGADILDKWVGESERKLRELFEKATRTRPSLIFFDELDGLAPERSAKNDQVHSSVVTTLLALMDGLDNMTGIIIIGATNRLDAIDPALRRPGRFDRELYFPLPCAGARKEILQVHMSCWKSKPSDEFMNHLAEITAGCCGSDLQAIITEAVMCCLKRRYPSINHRAKINFDLDTIRVEEEDFLAARMNIVPTPQRLGQSRTRRLSSYIQPLLQRQLDKIMRHIQVLLPHFVELHRKFLVGTERYAGRFVLKGHTQQGLNTHIIPALLQRLEHIQSYVLDVPTQYKEMICMALQNIPSVLVLSRVDEWWDIIDEHCQMSILSMLENIHSGVPMLLITTCTNDVPYMLQDHFYYNSSVMLQIEDPIPVERETFFAPLFFGSKCTSLYRLWGQERLARIKQEDSRSTASKTRRNASDDKKLQIRVGRVSKTVKKCNSPNIMKALNSYNYVEGGGRRSSHMPERQTSSALRAYYTAAISNLHKGSHVKEAPSKGSKSGVRTLFLNKNIKHEPNSESALVTPCYSEFCQQLHASSDRGLEDIFTLWKRISNVTSKNLPVLQLELLYDTVLACINVNEQSFHDVIQALKKTLSNFENRHRM